MRKNRVSVQVKELPAMDLSTLNSIEGEWRTARFIAMQVCYPYAPAISALVPIFDEKVGSWYLNEETMELEFKGTMATDKYFRCYISPHAVEKWKKEALEVSPSNPCENCGAHSHHELAYVAGTICHEAMHPLEKHHDRSKEILDFNMNLGNFCMDMEINDGLMDIFGIVAKEHGDKMPRICIPKGHLCHPNKENLPTDRLYEEYYYKLEDEQQKQQQKCQSGECGHGKDDHQKDGGKGQQGKSKHMGCGSGAHGEKQEWDAGDPNESGVEGVQEADIEFVRKEVAAKIRDAAKRGTMPGGMVRWADDVLAPPKYNWKKEFARTVRGVMSTTHGHDEPMYRKFARDCAASDYDTIAPSYYTPRPTVGIVMDTSGSMGYGAGSPMHQAVCEAQGICASLNADLELLDVDAEANAGDIQRVQKMKGIRLKGGGGTDMRVGIEVFRTRKGRKPDIVIVLTDGETPWPDHKIKEFRMVIGLVGDRVNSEVRAACPKWAKTVVIGPVDIK